MTASRVDMPTEKTGSGARRPRTVLIADDNHILNQAIADSLSMRGIKAISISNGLDTVPAIRESEPDLIILDVLMPGKNGHDICRELKSDPELRMIPVIMFTVRDQQEDRLAGLSLGADDYIAKPFLIEALMNKIEYLLEKR